ncbi:hypothetical protein D9758_003445 [Tetrapyrgos nigripes]|uniref:Uncharacterized protein n=1 Tax=Tetrapyrgos nigripes TaxID=182062 RepID=A0A8H5GV13_9AGAR|nr:hypothetical protein D9758_003445 [Tetrapyrgos nigripes]
MLAHCFLPIIVDTACQSDADGLKLTPHRYIIINLVNSLHPSTFNIQAFVKSQPLDSAKSPSPTEASPRARTELQTSLQGSTYPYKLNARDHEYSYPLNAYPHQLDQALTVSRLVLITM